MGNYCVCECPENLFKDEDMIVDRKGDYYSKTNEIDESKGLIQKQVSRAKFGNNQNRNVLSIDQGISMCLTHSNESVTVLGENNVLIDSPKPSRKSSLSKHPIYYLSDEN